MVKRRKIIGAAVPDSPTGEIRWCKFTGNSRQRRYQRRQTVWKAFELDQARKEAAELRKELGW